MADMRGGRGTFQPTGLQETQAAAIAGTILDDLTRPSSARGTLADRLVEMEALLSAARRVVAAERRLLGKGPHRLATPEYDRDRRLKRLAARFRLWQQVNETLAQIDRRRAFPLMSRDHARLDLRRAEHQIGDLVFNRTHRATNPAPQSDAAARLGCFPDIPTRVSLFLRIAHLAYRIVLARRHPGATRFLDVGCGGGLKVALAGQFFDQATGIEYDPAYAAAARRTLTRMNAHRCDIVEGDALGFECYGSFDVIFLYQPINHEARLAELEARILTHARPGTVILAPYNVRGDHWQSAPSLARHVHLAGLDGKQARAVARQVSRIGPHVANPDDALPDAVGWLAPLWRACLANGYDPAAWR